MYEFTFKYMNLKTKVVSLTMSLCIYYRNLYREVKN